MAGPHYLRALPAGTLRMSSAAGFAFAVEAAARRSYSSATKANTSTTTTSTSSATAPPPQAPSRLAAAAAPSTGSKTPKRGPFFVARTPSNKLPVYEELKKGGTQPSTLLRKIEGDAHTLKQELIQQLRLEANKVRVNPATNHIRIKGRYKKEINELLANMGF